MDTFGKRVAAARQLKAWSQNRLAKELGLSQSSLSELEAGPATSSKHSYRIAQLTGANITWLETGEGEMTGAEGREVPKGGAALSSQDAAALTFPELRFSSMPRDVPILGGASCGEDGLFEFNGQIHDHARRPDRLVGVKDVYALYVHGQSMSPWREPGELVYVHPHQPIKIGDYVVVQMKAESEGAPLAAYVKKLLRQSPTSITLCQFNPEKEIKIDRKKIASIHRVMNWSEVLGF